VTSPGDGGRPGLNLVLGTRGSELALTQSGHVADALRALGHTVELRTIRTAGDVTGGSLVQAGGTGVFAAALRAALLAGEVDLAVHSFKDLPTAPTPGLVVAAVPKREAPHDALCAPHGHTLRRLPEGARVGTGSPRRAAQLRALRPDLTVVEIRGNVPTRLARALGPDADLDAVVLAAAGLRRLGLAGAITEVLDRLLPAPGQGALAVECRADAVAVREALAALDDPDTRFAATAERAVLAGLGAGCAAPVGALCVREGVGHRLNAKVISPDGHRAVGLGSAVYTDVDPDEFGRRMARSLLAAGAADVTPLGAGRDGRLADFHDDRALWAPGTTGRLVGRRVLLPRADGPLADALRGAGAEVDCVPLTRTVPMLFPRLPRDANWVVFTSPTAVRVLAEAGYPLQALGRSGVAAVGPATRRALEEYGVRVALSPEGSATAAALGWAFPSGTGRVLIPGSELSSPELGDALRAKGWRVMAIPTYTTASLDEAPAGLVEAWRRGDFDAVVVTAGSVARAVRDLLGAPPAATAVVAFGSPSAAAATALGLPVAAVAATQDGPGLVAAVARGVPAVPEEAR
jgi:hydroxymethylbilane synthase